MKRALSIMLLVTLFTTLLVAAEPIVFGSVTAEEIERIEPVVGMYVITIKYTATSEGVFLEEDNYNVATEQVSLDNFFNVVLPAEAERIRIKHGL